MIKSVRKLFGIEQQFMADYLGISRSQVSMVEKGDRLLIGGKSLLMTEFYKILVIQPPSDAAMETMAPLLAQEEEKKAEVVKSQWLLATINLQKAQKKLTKMQAEYQRSLGVLEKMDQLKAISKPEDSSFLKAVELENAQVLRRTGLAVQWKIQMEIHLLQVQLDFLNNETGQ